MIKESTCIPVSKAVEIFQFEGYNMSKLGTLNGEHLHQLKIPHPIATAEGIL